MQVKWGPFVMVGSPPHSYKHQLISPTSFFMVSTLITLQALPLHFISGNLNFETSSLSFLSIWLCFILSFALTFPFLETACKLLT